MNLSNALYDKLKLVVSIVLPGLATLYTVLAGLYGWENTTQVVGTIAAVATFLGLFLGASARQYDGAGDLIVTTDPDDGEVYLSADLNKHPAAFKDKKNVTLNVKHQSAA